MKTVISIEQARQIADLVAKRGNEIDRVTLEFVGEGRSFNRQLDLHAQFKPVKFTGDKPKPQDGPDNVVGNVNGTKPPDNAGDAPEGDTAQDNAPEGDTPEGEADAPPADAPPADAPGPAIV